MRESILDRIDGGVADVFCYFSVLKPLYEGFDTRLVSVFLIILWHVVKDRFLDPFSVRSEIFPFPLLKGLVAPRSLPQLLFDVERPF